MSVIQSAARDSLSRADAAPGVAMAVALVMVSGVWLAGAVWSYEEQTAFAAAAGFLVPWLLPLTLDGLALALAAIATAASLDGRPAIQARLGTALTVAGSAASNAWWAWERTTGDLSPVVLAAAVPLASFVALEVLLAELRRQVHRRRGLPPPVAIPTPRLIRLALAPRRAFGEWRDDVLRRTAPPGVPVVVRDRSTAESVRSMDPAPVDASASAGEPPTTRRQQARRSRRTRTPSKQRPVEALRTELAASIQAGTLPADPTAEAIRKTLHIGLARARQLRDETGRAGAT
jgi:hypothetical protein